MVVPGTAALGAAPHSSRRRGATPDRASVDATAPRWRADHPDRAPSGKFVSFQLLRFSSWWEMCQLSVFYIEIDFS